jgi:hypothetical protein
MVGPSVHVLDCVFDILARVARAIFRNFPQF